tara:strand:- start:667 stop:930 length:264 start_codon:yes stop_codon:yes gene_type:complete
MDRLVKVKENYMEQFKENPIAVGLTFEEYLLLRLESAEAANEALMKLSGMDDFFQSLTPAPENFQELVKSLDEPLDFDLEEWRNDNV